MDRIQKLQQEENFNLPYLLRLLSVEFPRDKRLKYEMRRTPLLLHTLLSCCWWRCCCCALFLPDLIRTIYFSLRNFFFPHSQYFCPVFNSHQFTLRILEFIQLCMTFFSLLRMARHTMRTYRNAGRWHVVFFSLGQDLLQALTYRERIFGIASIVAPHTHTHRPKLYTSRNEII